MDACRRRHLSAHGQALPSIAGLEQDAERAFVFKCTRRDVRCAFHPVVLSGGFTGASLSLSARWLAGISTPGEGYMIPHRVALCLWAVFAGVRSVCPPGLLDPLGRRPAGRIRPWGSCQALSRTYSTIACRWQNDRLVDRSRLACHGALISSGDRKRHRHAEICFFALSLTHGSWIRVYGPATPGTD
jgi:hypothetical protein